MYKILFWELISLRYRFMQEFSVDDVDEDFVYLEISTKNTTTCDGVLDLLFTKPPKSDTCAPNRRILDSCDLMDGLPLDTSCIVRCPCPQNCEKLIKVTASSHTEPWILCPVTLAWCEWVINYTVTRRQWEMWSKNNIKIQYYQKLWQNCVHQIWK